MNELFVVAPPGRRATCADCGMRELALFADLAEQDFDLIHRPIEELRPASGDVLYRQGEPAGAIYTVRHGILKLVSDTADGRSRIVRLVGRGGTAGLESALGESYRHTAVALEPTTACRIPREVVDTLNRDTPRLCRQLMRRWQGAVDEAEHWLTALAAGPSRARVVGLVAHLARSSADGRFALPSREDMGALLDISKESASRVVAALRREGLLWGVGRGYFSADVRGLESPWEG